MEKFGEELLDDLLSKQEDIRKSNRRLSEKISEALQASSILRPPVLDITGSRGNTVVESEKEKGKVDVSKNKRKADNSPERRSQKNQKMASMEEKMDLLLARMAAMVTPEDVEKIATRVEDRLKTVEKNQDSFMEKQEAMDARISRIERGRDRSARRPPEGERARKPQRSNGNGLDACILSRESDAKAYELARKQIYFEPAEDNLEGVQAFMAGHLLMDPEAVVSLNIVDIRKVFQVKGRKKKNGNVKKKYC